jgi:MFS family permease
VDSARNFGDAGFQQLLDNKKIEKAPTIEVCRRHARDHPFGIAANIRAGSVLHLHRIHFAYAVGTLHMSRDLILAALMAAACLSFISIPLSGHISDRIGRKKMYLIGVILTGVWGFPYFGLVDTAIPSLVFIAIVLSLIPHDIQYGPQAALIAEAFTPRLRYSDASLGYQLASIVAGGPAPLIATALFAAYHSG